MAKKDLYDVSHLDVKHDIMFFDRSQLEKNAAWYPKGHKEMPEGGSETYIEQYRRQIAKNGHVPHWNRRDLCMINIEVGGKMGDQYTIDPFYDDKKMAEHPAWKMLRKDQKDECLRLRDLCVEAEIKYDLPKGTLVYTG